MNDRIWMRVCVGLLLLALIASTAAFALRAERLEHKNIALQHQVYVGLSQLRSEHLHEHLLVAAVLAEDELLHAAFAAARKIVESKGHK